MKVKVRVRVGAEEGERGECERLGLIGGERLIGTFDFPMAPLNPGISKV